MCDRFFSNILIIWNVRIKYDTVASQEMWKQASSHSKGLDAEGSLCWSWGEQQDVKPWYGWKERLFTETRTQCSSARKRETVFPSIRTSEQRPSEWFWEHESFRKSLSIRLFTLTVIYSHIMCKNLRFSQMQQCWSLCKYSNRPFGNCYNNIKMFLAVISRLVENTTTPWTAFQI